MNVQFKYVCSNLSKWLELKATDCIYKFADNEEMVPKRIGSAEHAAFARLSTQRYLKRCFLKVKDTFSPKKHVHTDGYTDEIEKNKTKTSD